MTGTGFAATRSGALTNQQKIKFANLHRSQRPPRMIQQEPAVNFSHISVRILRYEPRTAQLTISTRVRAAPALVHARTAFPKCPS